MLNWPSEWFSNRFVSAVENFCERPCGDVIGQVFLFYFILFKSIKYDPFYPNG